MIGESSRLRRSESFFGLHSDFHARPEPGLVIGATLREEDIREICETIRPDFIQVDCKGHPGWASYPTSFSNAMPEFKGDPLALWRRITKEYGIALYVHFSGVYETKYCREHPEEQVLLPDGTLSTAARVSVRLDGKYADTYLIPQICELAEKYDIDGVWLDGECWAAQPDYRPETIARFEEETGIDLKGTVPAQKGDAYYDEYLEFVRKQFRAYLNHYVDVLHEKYPKLQICSNWAFSHYMPEKVCANVDFLSGDMSPSNAVNSARYAGRMLAQHKMSWDLMSWNFRFQIYKTPLVPAKHPVQIMQEAAAVIALGGAYQDNISQFSDGSPDVRHIRRLLPLAKFMRERQPFCFGGKAIHQAVMFASTTDRYAELKTAYGRDGTERQTGMTALFCDAGQSLEIVCDHILKEHYKEYPMIIVPEIYSGIDDNIIELLREYANDGGSLLLIGTNTCRIFAEKGFGFSATPYTEIPEVPNWMNCNIGHHVEKYADCMPCYFSLGGEELGLTYGAMKIDSKSEHSENIGFLHSSLRSDGTPFAAVFNFGKGKVAAIGADFGTQYNAGMQILHTELIRRISEKLYEPLVRIENKKGFAEIVCLEKDGKLLLQIVNGNGGHTNPLCVSEDYIPPLTELELSVKLKNTPEKIVLQPENRLLDFEKRGDRIYFNVEKTDIHNIVVMDL